MNPARVERNKVRILTALPDIGPAIAKELAFIGIKTLIHLIGKDPGKLYETLRTKIGTIHGSCVLDVFISVTRFMDGEEPKPWQTYTEERKRMYATKR
jgi:hypothetical protein